MTGCSVAPELVSVVGSATSSYFSYQASKIEPVEVTTLSKDCILNLKYAQISCVTRRVMTKAEKQVISTNNRKLVEICGIDKPKILICP